MEDNVFVLAWMSLGSVKAVAAYTGVSEAATHEKADELRRAGVKLPFNPVFDQELAEQITVSPEEAVEASRALRSQNNGVAWPA